MKEKISNPAAFPVPENWCQDGMSLRDYFAAMAMMAFCRGRDREFEDVAAMAYKQADAMLAVRSANQL